MRRAVVLIAPLLLVIAGTAGCSDGSDGRTVTVDFAAQAVALEVGDLLVVDLGTVNASVGDGWDLVVEADPAVLGAAEVRSEYLGDEGEVGGPSTLAYAFEAVGPGTTTIELQYAYRGSTAEADTGRVDPAHTSLRVTVG
ncbi:protease inhibitor I42 family protein [Cellulomonas sp. KRMCY2]|uniref:protease inhibitor I42 family protein n=1 Tax=Cellulomonas sp. KRMCY2 TaxID=1304865 RepID=UPI00045EB5C7